MSLNKKKQPIRTIILDFDGILAESNEEKLQAFYDLFALYPKYQQQMLDYHLAHYAAPRLTKFRYYVYQLMGRSADTDLITVMSKQFSEFSMRRVIACPAVKGSQALLKEFYQQIPLYISSVTPQEELRHIVQARGIAPFFVEIYGNPPHPKPEAIHKILNRENVLPSETLFIGDSPSDYKAALETGIAFLGRDSGIPFAGIDIDLYHDLYQITAVIRECLEG